MSVNYTIYNFKDPPYIVARRHGTASLLKVIGMIGGEEAVYYFDQIRPSALASDLTIYNITAGIWRGYDDAKGVLVFIPNLDAVMHVSARRLYYAPGRWTY
jgi:hypothetical protein